LCGNRNWEAGYDSKPWLLRASASLSELITEPTAALEDVVSVALPTDLPPVAKARSADFYHRRQATDAR